MSTTEKYSYLYYTGEGITNTLKKSVVAGGFAYEFPKGSQELRHTHYSTSSQL